MFHQCIAREASSGGTNTTIKSLNYAPGPLDTEMQKEIREIMPECELRNAFIKMKAEESLIQPDASALKLMNILRVNEFTNGAHIDFYDCE
jgi:sepiapterin reductase